uniref:Uncharacterized protein n=1 Tax=Pithovirus LCDPAC01 TaxID=2506600 RepID=A0A481YQH8_9VIRU|nr:MAG: uncharacterized protein LCDPAC01_01540 [Pithovirus LCDPAC01]
MTLQFDGSYLGTYGKDDICLVGPTKIKTKGNSYPKLFVLLRIRNEYTPCILELDRKRNSYACIVDEFKPIFGLKKIGTHSITLKVGLSRRDKTKILWVNDGVSNVVFVSDKKTKFIVYRADYWETQGEITFKKPVLLSDESLSKHIEDVRKIFMFRYIVRIKETSFSDIEISDKTILSVNENNTVYTDEDRVKRMRWGNKKINSLLFPDMKTKREVLGKLVKGTTMEETMVWLSCQLDPIINRINRDYIGLSDVIKDSIYDVFMCDYG